MTFDPALTAEQITVLEARAKRRLRFAMIGGLSCFLAGFAIAFVYAIGDPLTGKTALLLGIIFAAMLVCLAVTGWLIWRLREPEAVQRQLIRRYTDRLQRSRSIGLLLFALIAVLVSPLLWRMTGKLMDGTGRLADVAHLTLWLGLALFNLCVVLGFIHDKKLKSVYDDEFSQTLRSRAMLIGFFILFCGAMGVFVAGLSEPARAVRALPLVLLHAVVATTLSFAIMDLRAGHEN